MSQESKRNKQFLTQLILIVLVVLMASCADPSPPPPEQPAIELTSTPAAIPTVSATPEETPIPTADIDHRLNALVERVPLAGVAVGIQFQDAFYEQGYGLADLPSERAVTDESLFKIASLTKAITAAAILHLSETSRLGLDDPISNFLPQTPEVAQNIRVRNLLNHTSGLPDMSIDTAQEALPETFTTAQAVEYYFSTVEQLDFEPGQGWSYGNVGYFLLGAIIENVSGMTYDRYFETNLFEPLGLNSIGKCPAQSGLLATGYHSMDGQLEAANPSNLELGGAAAALCSTVGDLLRWQAALTGGNVIDPESWERMITPEQLLGGQFLDYGFGVSVQQSDYGPAIMHEGATAGFNSYFVYYPEQDLNIVLLSNTDGFDPSLRAIAGLLAELVLES